jgi:hypothetical protein
VKDQATLPPHATMLAEQLAGNPRNRVALDYLLGLYLVSGDLESVAHWAGRLGDVGYDRLPRHVDEAMALYEAGGGGGIDARVRPSADARARLREFTIERAAVLAARGDARAALRERFGGTYFYYYAFDPEGGAATP